MTFQANSDHDKIMQFSMQFLVKEHSTDMVGVVSDASIELNNRMQDSGSVESEQIAALNAFQEVTLDLRDLLEDAQQNLSTSTVSKDDQDDATTKFDAAKDAFFTNAEQLLLTSTTPQEVLTLINAK